MIAIETRDLVKTYKDTRAVDGVTLSLEEGRIYGLLGRNGAGKTTLMKLLTGQIFASRGEMKLLGQHPVENAEVLAQTCFIQESQRYPDTFRARDVFKVAAAIYPAWDSDFAEQLVEDFRLPVKRGMKKLSRGQLSAVGIIVGLASRAPLTFFDEPYLGLDAVARQKFYDRLLADYAEHPRTIVLSTHHIDEAANLLEHVVVIDDGHILLNCDTDELRGSALHIAGQSAAVDALSADRTVYAREQIGGLASATIAAQEGDAERAEASGLTVTPVSLQNLIVHLTTQAERSSVAA
ncbi:ABC transporter ATP-binding protein [Microbacterium sp. YY-01]|uniref:ABC transporter ATP-binding protein n=1 Tax=Microbacterium sp. YY-01 TaxID=3421634 RepID=UPI003D177CA9